MKTFPTYEVAQRIVKENGITSQTDYKSSYQALGLPSAPYEYYKDKGWIDWYSFFGKTKASYPTYEEAQRIVKENGINSQGDYMSSYQALGLPSNPTRVYKDKGWIDWYAFFGKEKKEYPSYEKTLEIVQKEGIQSLAEYNKRCKELGLPNRPEIVYKDKGWIDSYAFFGKEKKEYPSYEKALEIVQKEGIKNVADYFKSCKRLGLPSHPERVYKDKGWIDWYDFLGIRKTTYPSYEKALEIVQKEGIHSHDEYNKRCKELGLPSNPELTYKDKGWIDSYAFFGKEKKEYPSYENALEIVQKEGIKSSKDYNKSYKRLGLPPSPPFTYKDRGWIDWYSFFGKTKVSYPHYKEAQRIVKENGIKSQSVYKTSCKDYSLPLNPNEVYKDKGWIDWYDFLGKSRLISKDERKYNILKRLAITPALLKDDAPLQVIYIFVSQFNKELAKEIETLLGTSSYEERLNWVKEQLKGLKDGSSSKVKSSDETSIDGLEEDTDELSALESIVEENKDVMDTLSEEKLERLNIIYENYVHSVANRELIAEYDDKRKKHTT